jgi:hypothetical protein
MGADEQKGKGEEGAAKTALECAKEGCAAA